MSNPVIDVRNLTKDYGKGRGIFDVSFRMEPGEVFGFLGSNGAGKTVTMRHLMGFIRPQKGTASVLGLDCFNQRAQIQGHLGYLPGEISIADDMTGIAFLTFMAKMKGIRNLDYMHQLIERFQLDPKPKIRKMSKGTKQKVGLVCAFMGKPQVLLLDEPTSGLDPVVRELVKKLLVDFVAENGASVMIASHNLRELEDVCDHVGLLHRGGALCEDDLDRLKLGITRLQFALADPADFETVRAGLNLLKCSQQGKLFEMTVRGTETETLALVQRLHPLFCETLPITLEELFISEMEVAGYDINKVI